MKLRVILIGAAVVASFGCVERSLKITTEPQGALVWLNDREIGRTPVTVPFEWYGDYDVIIRKEGSETLKTHQRVKAPWYEYPPFDLFAEVFWPATIYDTHAWHFELAPAEEVSEEALLDRAVSLRREARGEAAPVTEPLEAPVNEAVEEPTQE